MSEIQDAAQIIRVSLEGAEIILKIGKANWDFVKGVCAVFSQMLDQEKLAGKTSVRQLLKSGGDLQVFKFRSKDLHAVKKLADKYGLLYSILPDLNKKDGMSEILFHSQAVPRIKAIMERIQGSQIESMDDYFANAEKKEMGAVLQEAEKEHGRTGKKGCRNEGERLSGDFVETGVASDKMDAIRRFQKRYIENPKVNGITIARKLVVEETEQSMKTRIPYKQDEYIWLPKSEITWINGDKTVYAGLEKEREYQVVDGADRPIRRASGLDLYKQSYDPVNRSLEGREQDRIRRRQNKEQQGKTWQNREQQEKEQQNKLKHSKGGQDKAGQNKTLKNQRRSGNTQKRRGR